MSHGAAATRRSRRTRLSGDWLLSLPLLAGVVLLVVLPLVAAGVLAFTEYYGFDDARFTGLDNFRRAAGDELFLRSLGTAAILVLLIVPVRLALAVGLALLLHRPGGVSSVGRVSAYLPSVIPDAAWALLWLWFLNPLYGPLPLALEAVGLPSPGFLTETWGARSGIALMLSLQVGESFVVALAARRYVPSSLYDAAAVEGASAWHTTRRLTLPHMRPLLVLLAARDAILVLTATFIPVLLVTDGGPRYATLTAPLHLYERAFVYGELGYASALSVVLFASTAVTLAVAAVAARRILRTVS
jgi:multiple sugar transport system permease protein